MRRILVLKYLERKPKILEQFCRVFPMTKTAYLETLSKNVAALRKAKGWNQEELARKAGLSQKVISNLESASEKKIHPTLNTIVSVADAFGVSVFLLLTQLNDSRIEQLTSSPP